uniref:Uncharacterized protein n=1 Tax=Lepeophtheirus salmonis TaxID=72036 RepID=A0A0K2TC13_LEPSM
MFYLFLIMQKNIKYKLQSFDRRDFVEDGMEVLYPRCRQCYDGTPKNPDISYHRFPGFNIPPIKSLNPSGRRLFQDPKLTRKRKRLSRQ